MAPTHANRSVPHSRPMSGRRHALITVWLLVPVVLAGCSSSPDIDEEFPPGDPTLGDLGDNPVLGSDGPGAIAETDNTNYGLLALLAVCLIAAGVLLVKVERWERRRSEAAGNG